MSRLKLYILIGVTLLPAVACKSPKPKPVSSDVSKTAVVVDGKKDSVINNPHKKYGGATVAEPCVKCILEVIQDSKSFQENTTGLSAQNINYTINWVKASAPGLVPDTSNKTNGLRVDVKKDENGEETRLCSYVYNNSSGTMYLLSNENKYLHPISSITPAILKKIRNNCYWGVASAGGK